jgi:2-polyprenyl-3-methyl-5-hydroxy-6-metoxy-1,4-benzoquinol methylase
MEASEYRSGKDYLDKFNPSLYLQRYADVRETRSQHVLRCYHGAFQDLPQGISVLDYGSGPAILGAISAATKASEIVLSDYSNVNRQSIRDWLENKPNAFDWAPHFTYVVKELEGREEDEVVKRQQGVRNLVKAVAHCDLSQDPPIDESCNKLYDVVISSLVLEVLAKSFEEYTTLLSRTVKLVKPGGVFLLYGVENCPYYEVGDLKFRSFLLTSTMTTEAMEKCGLSNIHVDKFVSPFDNYKKYMFFKCTLTP